jgi:microcystin-dependent protein
MPFEPFIAEIYLFAGNFAPRGYAFCDGSLLSIAQNTALFSILGTTYGGNGTTNFALPDLRGRVPIGAGNGPGLTPRVQGEKSGEENHTLNSQEMPQHSHSATVGCVGGATAGNSKDPTGRVWAKDLGTASATYSNAATNANMAPSITVSTTGGNQGHNNMQPYLALNYVIALVGIFPSRN